MSKEGSLSQLKELLEKLESKLKANVEKCDEDECSHESHKAKMRLAISSQKYESVKFGLAEEANHDFYCDVISNALHLSADYVYCVLAAINKDKKIFSSNRETFESAINEIGKSLDTLKEKHNL